MVKYLLKFKSVLPTYKCKTKEYKKIRTSFHKLFLEMLIAFEVGRYSISNVYILLQYNCNTNEKFHFKKYSKNYYLARLTKGK